jgi:Na+(H+)/acetate symporter ActP
MGWTGGYVLLPLLAPYLRKLEIYRSRFYWRTLLL